MTQGPARRSRRNSKHRRRIGEYILNKFQHRCVYCGGKRKLGIDHLFPIGQGGADKRDNMVACCKKCNTSKANMTVIEWIQSGKAPAKLVAYINERLFL